MSERTESDNSATKSAQQSQAGDHAQPTGAPLSSSWSQLGFGDSNPRNLTPQMVLQLQRTIGNQATTQLISQRQKNVIQRVKQLKNDSTGNEKIAAKVSSQSGVSSAGATDSVYLIRGVNSQAQLVNIIKNGTAGGGSPARSDEQAPSEEEAVDQVSFEAVPWKVTGAKQAAMRQSNDVEYTTDITVAKSFGLNRAGVVVIKIKKTYLVEGSTSESGWLCYKDAPVKVVYVMLPDKKE